MCKTEKEVYRMRGTVKQLGLSGEAASHRERKAIAQLEGREGVGMPVSIGWETLPYSPGRVQVKSSDTGDLRF